MFRRLVSVAPITLTLLLARPAAAAPTPADTAPSGVDLSKLTDGEKKIFFDVAGKVGSACGKAHSLLQSAKSDPKCKRSQFALRHVAKLAGEGFVASEIAEAMERRYGQKPAKIDVSTAPYKGDKSAPVELVEFIDLQCGHCKAIQPVLQALLDDNRGKLKVHLKHFPLQGHPQAAAAAEVAAAAAKQGKFWAVLGELLKNQERLGPADIERHLQAVGVDLKRLQADMGHGKQVVAKDRAEGEKLKIEGTPTLYLNGRLVTDLRDIRELQEWVDEELACR